MIEPLPNYAITLRINPYFLEDSEIAGAPDIANNPY